MRFIFFFSRAQCHGMGKLTREFTMRRALMLNHSVTKTIHLWVTCRNDFRCLPSKFVSEQRKNPAFGACAPRSPTLRQQRFSCAVSAYFDYHRYFLVSDINHWVSAPASLTIGNISRAAIHRTWTETAWRWANPPGVTCGKSAAMTA
jgi:hypothetical protein